MIVAVFRAHRTEGGLGEEYAAALKRMEDLATKMPGYVSHKAYVAEDGERLTLVERESIETLRGASRARPDQGAGARTLLRGLSSPGVRGPARIALYARGRKGSLSAGSRDARLSDFPVNAASVFRPRAQAGREPGAVERLRGRNPPTSNCRALRRRVGADRKTFPAAVLGIACSRMRRSDDGGTTVS
jgi:heme-degrading monooxygenase HmoA